VPDLNSVQLPNWVLVPAQILLILVVAWLAIRLARIFVHGVFRTLIDREAREGTARELTAVELQRRMETLDGLGASLLQLVIVVIGALMVLDRLGVDIGPAVAGIGIAGIAVGFGAQSLVRDYFNGALILVENQYGKGDVVRIAGVEGTVEDLTLRRTTLRDFDGNVHTVPNSAVVVASNLTRGWARISEQLRVPSAGLVGAATDLVDRVGREMAADPVWRGRLLDAPHVERIGALGPGGITLGIGARVEAVHRWSAVDELRGRLLDAVRRDGLPFAPEIGAADVNPPPGSPAPAAVPVSLDQAQPPPSPPGGPSRP
jgi:small-conductance mechanosensitive channel